MQIVESHIANCAKGFEEVQTNLQDLQELLEAESPVLAALLKGNYFLLLGMYIDAASAIETLSGLIDEETNPENIFHYQVCRLFLETFHLMLLERNADVRDIQFRHEAFVEDLESQSSTDLCVELIPYTWLVADGTKPQA